MPFRARGSPGRARVLQEALETSVLMLSPIVPHICHRDVARAWARHARRGRALAASRIRPRSCRTRSRSWCR